MKKLLFYLVLLILLGTIASAQDTGTVGTGTDGMACTTHSDCTADHFCIGEVCRVAVEITSVCTFDSRCVSNTVCYDNIFTGIIPVVRTASPTTTSGDSTTVRSCTSISECLGEDVCYENQCMSIEDATTAARIVRGRPTPPDTSDVTRTSSTTTDTDPPIEVLRTPPDTTETDTTTTSTDSGVDLGHFIWNIINSITGGTSSTEGIDTDTTTAGTTDPVDTTTAGPLDVEVVTVECAIFADEPYPANTVTGCTGTPSVGRELEIVNDLAAHTDGLGNLHPNWIVRLLYLDNAPGSELQVLFGFIDQQYCGGVLAPGIIPTASRTYTTTPDGTALSAEYVIRPEIGWWEPPGLNNACHLQNTDQMILCDYSLALKARSIQITHSANTKVTVRMSSFYPDFDYVSQGVC